MLEKRVRREALEKGLPSAPSPWAQPPVSLAGPVSQCFQVFWTPSLGPPSALFFSFRWSRDSSSPNGLLASFNSPFLPSNAPALKPLPDPYPGAPKRENSGKLGAKRALWTENKVNLFCLLEKSLDCPGNWPLSQNLINSPQIHSSTSSLSTNSRSQTLDPPPNV